MSKNSRSMSGGISGRRQNVRKGILLFMFLIFPVTMNFLSPYVIVDGAAAGIVSGSFIFFGVLFLSSLIFGRAFCGWICPGGAVQEMCFPVRNSRVNRKRLDWIKYLIWVPWMGAISGLFIAAGGIQKIDPLHLTETGISVDEPAKYIIYYGVLSLLVIIPLFAGRRAACHSICWMAPFMIAGRKIRNLLKWPSLRLVSNSMECTSCRLCEKLCPMSLDVEAMVADGKMEHAECILCGQCADVCPRGLIRFSFSGGTADAKENRGREKSVSVLTR